MWQAGWSTSGSSTTPPPLAPHHVRLGLLLLLTPPLAQPAAAGSTSGQGGDMPLKKRTSSVEVLAPHLARAVRAEELCQAPEEPRLSFAKHRRSPRPKDSALTMHHLAFTVFPEAYVVMRAKLTENSARSNARRTTSSRAKGLCPACRLCAHHRPPTWSSSYTPK